MCSIPSRLLCSASLTLVTGIFSLAASLSTCPTIISREEWGSRPPIESPVSIPDNLPYWFVHHSESTSCSDFESCCASVRSIQNYHMDTEGWNDIGYSFLIGGDGNIYEGRGWNVQGAHTYNYNTVGYGICFVGDFMIILPEESAQNIYFNLTECAVSNGKIATTYEMYGHRQPGGENGNTTCPGDALYRQIQSWPHWMPGKPSYMHNYHDKLPKIK